MCTFVDKEGKKTLGFIYKDDIDESGDVKIFCYEQKDKKGNRKLRYTSSEKEYKDALLKQGVKY